MQDNVLKKQFNERAVKRVRDLIKGTTSEATGTQIGYTKQFVPHSEGDIWEENFTITVRNNALWRTNLSERFLPQGK